MRRTRIAPILVVFLCALVSSAAGQVAPGQQRKSYKKQNRNQITKIAERNVEGAVK